MSSYNICQEVNIVGGVYKEICYWPKWDAMFGSAWRAVRVFRAFSPNANITLHTIGNDEIKKMMTIYAKAEKLNPQVRQSSSITEFHYDYPLSIPVIYRQKEEQYELEASGSFMIGFGMLEAKTKISGEWVVYDPQSPRKPLSFRRQGGQSEHLALVMNEGEAKLLSGKQDISSIKTTLFEQESCECLVVKCGAKGAMLYTSKDDEGSNIPVYKTSHVWPIGSGDVFTTVFSFYWFSGFKPIDAAINASKAVAAYCNNKGYIEDLPSILQRSLAFEEFFPQKKGQVYLAGPFFTLSEKLFVSKCRNILTSMGVQVFSPYHDVGEGEANYVAPKDIEELKKSSCVFAIIDGLDSGTLFEVGFAVSSGIKVVAYVENETEGALKMLSGTGCDIESDFSTALYKTCWYAAG